MLIRSEFANERVFEPVSFLADSICGRNAEVFEPDLVSSPPRRAAGLWDLAHVDAVHVLVELGEKQREAAESVARLARGCVRARGA